MRIAFITFEYPPFIIGGAGTYASGVTRELAKLGHDVVVFTPKIGDSKIEECTTNNLEIKRIEINQRLPFTSLQFWLTLPKIFKKVENIRRFDIIHFNGALYLFIKRFSKLPHLTTIHHLTTDASKINKPSLISRLKDFSGDNNFIMPFIEKRCIDSADRLIAVSRYTKDRIIDSHKIPSDRIDLIYNGIDSYGYIFPKEELKCIKERLNINERQIILSVGRVDDPRKNLKLLLRSFKMVLERIDALLLIVGKGNQKDIKNDAELLGILDNIIFAGFVDEITLKKYYALCDVYVCTSRLEGFGLTILEAVAAKKPIVATNVGAIPEIIGDNGILVNSVPEDISNAIINVLSDKQLDRKTVHESIADYSWSRNAEELLNVYERMVRE